MRFGKLKEACSTLHFRLTVWHTLVVFLMVVVTLLGVREALRIALLHEIDQLLFEDAEEMRLTLQEPDLERVHHELERKASTHAHRGLFLQLLDKQGKVIWQTATAPQEQTWTKQKIAPGRPVSSGDFRLLQRRLPQARPPLSSIVLGSSLKPLQADVTTLTQLMLIVGAVTLLVSPLGGYWLAGRATRPLAEIIDTTSRLHPTNLEERLDVRGTRDELDRLSRTINGFLDRIAAYLEQNRQFTANAAHELRSPLAAIQTSMEVALNAERTADEYKELIGETLEECGVLRDLVNQMLLLAESDAGQLDIGPDAIPLDRVVEKACEMFAGVAESFEIKLKLDLIERVEVYGDASRLRQVINNLIDNAIKFTPQGGTIVVRLCGDPSGKNVVLQVVDSGTGIPPQDLPHVFERFYRGDKSRQRKERSGGTGLGLSICQSIVAAHSGTIDAASVVGQGTTFTVTLPSARSSRPGEIGLPLGAIEPSGVG